MKPGRVPLAAGAVFLAAACERSAPPAAPPPRALLVTWDTVRADRVGAYGAPARTPCFDALAARGALYEQAQSVAPITLTAHASMLTGTWPQEHGVRDNAIFELSPAALLLSEALRDAGFRTGAFVGAYVLDPKFGLAQGFDVYDAPDASRSAASFGVVERPAGAVVDAALRFIDELKPDDRFFLWVHLYDPHEPHLPPPDLARPGADNYDLEIESCDRETARLLERLRARGLDRGLVTLVTADHGESLGEHGEKTHGIFLYEATTRVPLVVAPPPPGAAPGTRLRAPVSNADVAVTLLERLGIGRASLPAARTPALPAADGPPADERALLLESFTSFYFRHWSPLRAVVWQGFKYVQAPRPELYSLVEDPRETRDLAAARPELAVRMAARLRDLLAEHPPLRWGERSAVTGEDRRRFEQLGYAVGEGGAEDDSIPEGLPDPKDRIGELELRDRLIALLREASSLLGLDGTAAPPGTKAEEAARRERAQSLLDEARSGLRRLEANDPEDPMVLGFSPTIELALGNWAAAAAGFEKLVARNPRHASNHHNLANAYLRLGRTAWARREMEKAAQLDPGSALAPRWLMELALGARDWPAAAWWLDDLLRRPGLAPAERSQLEASRARVQAQLALVNASPRPPALVSEAELEPESVRGSKGGGP